MPFKLSVLQGWVHASELKSYVLVLVFCHTEVHVLSRTPAFIQSFGILQCNPSKNTFLEVNPMELTLLDFLRTDLLVSFSRALFTSYSEHTYIHTIHMQ